MYAKVEPLSKCSNNNTVLKETDAERKVKKLHSSDAIIQGSFDPVVWFVSVPVITMG